MDNHIKHLFFLLAIGIMSFTLFCATGCGGSNSCETVQCGSYDEEDASLYGMSIPGCGGCLTSGSGCGSCLWPQAFKVMYGTVEDSESATYVLVDNQYFSSGCLGCGQTEESCYSGIVAQDAKNWGFIYGSTDSKEHLIGCSNGCGGCFSSDSSDVPYIISLFEFATGIN